MESCSSEIYLTNDLVLKIDASLRDKIDVPEQITRPIGSAPHCTSTVNILPRICVIDSVISVQWSCGKHQSSVFRKHCERLTETMPMKSFSYLTKSLSLLRSRIRIGAASLHSARLGILCNACPPGPIALQPWTRPIGRTSPS